MKGDRIPAQNLNRRIAVVRAGAAVDDGLEFVPGPLQLLCERFASVKPVRRREVFEAHGKEARADLSAWVRFDAETRQIVATDKVVFDGRLYELTAAPVEVGRGYALELLLVADDDSAPVDVTELDPVA